MNLYSLLQKAAGISEVYIILGYESIVAPDHILHELILDGMNESFDSLVSKYDDRQEWIIDRIGYG